MRQIKFRLRQDDKIVGYEIWDNESYDLEDWSWCYSKDNNSSNLEFIPHNRKDQFTGLLDKNGKEIYEGDIIKSYDNITTHDTHIGIVFKNMERTPLWNTWCVKPIDGKKTDFKNDLLWNWSGENGHEIIGNIFENPDLIPKN